MSEVTSPIHDFRAPNTCDPLYSFDLIQIEARQYRHMPRQAVSAGRVSVDEAPRTERRGWMVGI